MPHASATQTYFQGLVAWQAGDVPEAVRLFQATLARRPGHNEAMQHLGLAALGAGRLELASRLFEACCRLKPRDATYAFNLGYVRLRQGRTDDALAVWARCARLDPCDDDAWRAIAIVSAQRGEWERAVEAFHAALAVDPDAADLHRGLASALRRIGRTAQARTASARARAVASDADALIRFAKVRSNAGRVEQAVRALSRAVRLRPDDARVQFQAAEAFATMRRTRQARAACRRALAAEPSHPDAAFLAAALDGRTPPAPPDGHAARLFDPVADSFDVHLVQELGYRGPALVWSAVMRALRADGRRAEHLAILDAGCGTGLAARLLRPAARRLMGVDLSPRMLRKARERGVYDRLVCGDLVEHLLHTRTRYNLVFAADVFIYLGALERLMRAARRALLPGGLLAFSVELCDGTGYRLEPSERYAHSQAYVTRVAADSGFSVRRIRSAVLRYEDGVGVDSGIVVLERD